jgi:alcohol dehydrogenase (cytochrome c)
MGFTGNAGGDNFGVTGRIFAPSAADGRILWRFETVPESGPAQLTWMHVTPDNPPTGGDTWTTYAPDGATGVLYLATGNVAPDFIEQIHPGDNLYTTRILA